MSGGSTEGSASADQVVASDRLSTRVADSLGPWGLSGCVSVEGSAV